jgi:hypothetical protein
MPRFDETGPRGIGAMTGGGMGICIVSGGIPTGSSYGIRHGVGYGYTHRAVSTNNAELDSLRREIQSLKDSLSRIKAQIENLTEIK